MLMGLDPNMFQAATDSVLRRPEPRASGFLQGYIRERFIADYVDDSRLTYRLSRIMRRVGLPDLPDISQWLSRTRRLVYQHADELLPA
jgi:hypothetical protein